MHLYLAIASSVLGVISLVPYVRDIFRGTTKPHAFTWFIWGAINIISTATLVSSNAGPAAYATATGSVLCFLIFFLSLRFGVTSADTIDIVCFIGACIAGVAYLSFSSPLVAVILISLTDLFGYVPTLRKASRDPYSETLSTYVISAGSIICALGALEVVTVTTTMYLLSILITNVACIAVLVRGRALMRARAR